MDIVDILQGSLSLIFVLISFIIGVSIISKYGKIKNRLYILVGLTWLTLSTLWLPEATSFLMSLIIQQTLAVEWYFILGNNSSCRMVFYSRQYFRSGRFNLLGYCLYRYGQ
ncbi:MAG: hypothetical protein ACTSQ1_09370 [Promethearchaeota archaeon]